MIPIFVFGLIVGYLIGSAMQERRDRRTVGENILRRRRRK